eukprot:scaffold7880_cov70-Cyclotella_meneghiniana.AAC.2
MDSTTDNCSALSVDFSSGGRRTVMGGGLVWLDWRARTSSLGRRDGRHDAWERWLDAVDAEKL